MTNLSRRSLLRFSALGTVGLLAGCLSSGTPDGDDTEDPDPTDETTTTTPEPTPDDEPLPGAGDSGNESGGTRLEGTGGPGVSVVSVGGASSAAIETSVEVVDEAATEDTPPTVRVTVTNVGDDAVSLGEARDVVFAYTMDDRRQLILLPYSDETNWPVEAGCWRLSEPIAVTQEYRIAKLAPGESLSQLLGVFGAPTEEDACLPVGTFDFEAEIAVGAEGSLPDGGDSITWGFTLSLE